MLAREPRRGRALPCVRAGRFLALWRKDQSSLIGEGVPLLPDADQECGGPLPSLPRAIAQRLLDGAATQPSGSRISAVVGPRVESNRCVRGCSANRVNDDLEDWQKTRWQSDATADYDAVIACRCKLS